MKRHPDEGLSEVVGFVLLLALIVAAFSLWMTYTVPANGREIEISQMNLIESQFTNYKATLDTLLAGNESGVTTSTSFPIGTLGGNTQVAGLQIPMMQPIGSIAQVSLNSTGDTITVSGSSSQNDTTVTSQFPLAMTSLSYQSYNNYWIQQQLYYQMGGVFLSQTDGVTNRIAPPISIYPSTSNTTSVNIVLVQLDGSRTISGSGNVRVDTRLRSLPQYNISTNVSYFQNKWVSISVNVKDNKTASTWSRIFRSAASREGLNTSWYTITTSTNATSGRGTATILINGADSTNVQNDVLLTVTRAEYLVTLNDVSTNVN